MKIKDIFLVLSLISLTVSIRICPHLPDCTPIFAVLALLLQRYSVLITASVLAFILVLSGFFLPFDKLSFLLCLGSYALSLFIAYFCCQHFFSRSLILTLGFWIFSDLAVFVFSPLYAQTLQGFFACFSAALPFLNYSLLGTALWAMILHPGLWARLKTPTAGSKYARSL